LRAFATVIADFCENDLVYRRKAAARGGAGPQQPPPPRSPTIVPMLLSKELLCAQFRNSGCPVHMRVLRVPPAPAMNLASDAASSTSSPPEQTGKENKKKHPFDRDGPLGEDSMPSKNGWNMVIIADKGAAGWFVEGCYPRSTPMGALITAKHYVVNLGPFKMPLTRQKFEQEKERTIQKYLDRECQIEESSKSRSSSKSTPKTKDDVEVYFDFRKVNRTQDRIDAEINRVAANRAKIFYSRSNEAASSEKPKEMTDKEFRNRFLLSAAYSPWNEEEVQRQEEELDAIYSRILKQLYVTEIVQKISEAAYNFTTSDFRMGDVRSY
jgi:hypothetical protein